MTAAELIFQNRAAAVRAGKFPGAVVPREESGRTRNGGERRHCTSVRRGIALPWEDEHRRYNPGEMTTHDWVLDVLEAIIQAPGAKIGQSTLTDVICERRGVERKVAAPRISASLYWLRVCGAIVPRERRPPAPNRRPTTFWQLAEVLTA